MSDQKEDQKITHTVERELVRKVARAFWIEKYVAENPDASPTDAGQAWKETDSKPHLKTTQKALNRLSRNNINVVES